MDFNLLGTLLLIGLLVWWKLDFIASLLNLKAHVPELPAEFEDVWDSQKYAEAQEYEKAGTRFGIITSLFSLFSMLIFWFIGGFPWLWDLVEGVGYGPLLSGLLYFVALFGANFIISIPFEIYETFVIEARFGFNKTTKATFIVDRIKSLLLMAILGLPLLAGLLWIFSNVPNAWIWGWGLVTAFSLLLTYLAPSLILPLFNKFKPLEDGELKEAIHEMARKCKFPLTEVSIMDGSKRSAKSNAFFTGFGKHKKIALYDTLVDNHSVENLVGVLAHEIGHFKKRHILQRMFVSLVQTFVIFYLLGMALDVDGAFARDLGQAFGFESFAPLAPGLILFFILLKPVQRILSVAANAWSRVHEFEADAYAADVQESGEHLIAALKKLSLDNLSNLTPHPMEVFLHHSHPPVMERIQALKSQ